MSQMHSYVLIVALYFFLYQGFTSGKFKTPKASDLNIFEGIAKKFESSNGAGDGWEVLQREIVNFQTIAALDYRNVT